MRHGPSLDVLRRELRAEICRRCPMRPSGSRWPGPDVPHSCEARCAIFTSLPRAYQIGEYLDPMVEPYEQALRHLYQQVCCEARAEPDRGSRCDVRPLQRYEDRVVEVLSAMFNRTA